MKQISIVVFFLPFLFSSFTYVYPKFTGHVGKKYVYKINNEDAVKLLKNGYSDIFLYNLIDSIPFSTSGYNKMQGNFILTYAQDTSFYAQYIFNPKQKIDIHLFNNGFSFLMQITDTIGKQIENATVVYNNDTVHFNKEILAYYLPKQYDSVWMTVKYFDDVYLYWVERDKPKAMNLPCGLAITNKTSLEAGDTLKIEAEFWNNRLFDAVNRPVLRVGHPFVNAISSYISRSKTMVNIPINKELVKQSEYDPMIYMSFDKEYDISLNSILHWKDSTIVSKNQNLLGLKSSYIKNEKVSLSFNDPNNIYLSSDDSIVVCLYVGKILETKSSSLEFKNLIWKYKCSYKRLLNNEVQIPNTVFLKGKVQYSLSINIPLLQNRTISFIFDNREICPVIKLVSDTIKVTTVKNSNIYKTNGVLYYISDNDTICKKRIQTPYSEIFRSDIKSYLFISDDGFASDKVTFSPSDIMITVSQQKVNDSILLHIHNPIHIPFFYQIFEKSKVVMQGKDNRDIDLILSEPKTENKIVRIFFLLNGSEQMVESIVLSKELKDKFTILKYTNDSLHHQILFYNDNPELLGNKSPLLLYPFKSLATVRSLDFKKWHCNWGISHKDFKEILHPTDSLHVTTLNIKDTITQFAPFTILDNQVTSVRYIYVNNKLIYLGNDNACKEKQIYSFPVDTFINELRIRTWKGMYVARNIALKKGVKNILSINLNLSKNYKLIENGHEMMNDEYKLFKNSVFTCNDYIKPYTYIKQKNRIIPLTYSDTLCYGVSIGPFDDDSIDVIALDGFKDSLFAGVRVKQIDKKAQIARFKKAQAFIYNYQFNAPSFDIFETAPTEQSIKQRHATDRFKTVTSIPRGTSHFQFERDYQHNTGIYLKINIPNNSKIQHAFLINSEGKAEYFTGDQNFYFNSLMQDKYRFVFFFNNETYFKTAEIDLKLDTIIFKTIAINQSDMKLLNQSEDVRRLLWNVDPTLIHNDYIKDSVYTLDPYNGEGILISGVVSSMSQEKKNKIAGAIIEEENTRNRVYANKDGRFQLYVKSKESKLIIGNIAYERDVILVGEKKFFDIILKEAYN